MKKIFLATAMCAVFGFAGDNTDLLALATGNEAKGASYELSSNEMQDVVGGSYQFVSKVRNSTLGYVQSVGNITEGYYDNSAQMYARKMNSGSTSVWIKYTQNGTTFQAIGTEANRLIALYGSTALSYAK